ncbi:MAG: DNA/RNA nuclease SfsA [Candidatus Obscuribacterales bacterium]
MPLSEPLVGAKLLRRYKRFLADVELPDGRVIVVHCPNPGSMLGVCDAGAPIYLRPAQAQRKLPFSWVLIGVGDYLVNVDTLMANKVMFEALKHQLVPDLAQYDCVEKEKTYGDSRFDFLLTHSRNQQPACYLEVKSTTLVDGKTAMFPDAKTARGRKHLQGLVQAKRAGLRAVQFFSIARGDVEEFRPAGHIDPDYCQALVEAAAAGVEVMAWTTDISWDNGQATFMLGRPVPVCLPKLP